MLNWLNRVIARLNPAERRRQRERNLQAVTEAVERGQRLARLRAANRARWIEERNREASRGATCPLDPGWPACTVSAQILGAISSCSARACRPTDAAASECDAA